MVNTSKETNMANRILYADEIANEARQQGLGEQIVKPEPTWIFREFPL